jgi:hypothetical protein
MNKYYTSIISKDGFGAQYQRIIQTYIYCNMNNLNFVYNPLDQVEHNYDNDNEYNNKLENLMNLKNNIKNIKENEMNIEVLDYGSQVRYQFEDKIDEYCNSEHMQFIKQCFWENKNKNFFNNDKINVAVHIRRENIVDNGQAEERVTTPNHYYLNIMNLIRQKNKDKNVLFHIYSQGNIEQFQELEREDVLFYLNEDIIPTFIGMVSAKILVISPSSFSYSAALISDGEIYYKPFWHKHRSNWNICN